jgi:hypothetical protein
LIGRCGFGQHARRAGVHPFCGLNTVIYRLHKAKVSFIKGIKAGLTENCR